MRLKCDTCLKVVTITGVPEGYTRKICIAGCWDEKAKKELKSLLSDPWEDCEYYKEEKCS